MMNLFNASNKASYTKQKQRNWQKFLAFPTDRHPGKLT